MQQMIEMVRLLKILLFPNTAGVNTYDKPIHESLDSNALMNVQNNEDYSIDEKPVLALRKIKKSTLENKFDFYNEDVFFKRMDSYLETTRYRLSNNLEMQTAMVNNALAKLNNLKPRKPLVQWRALYNKTRKVVRETFHPDKYIQQSNSIDSAAFIFVELMSGFFTPVDRLLEKIERGDDLSFNINDFEDFQNTMDELITEMKQSLYELNAVTQKNHQLVDKIHKRLLAINQELKQQTDIQKKTGAAAIEAEETLKRIETLLDKRSEFSQPINVSTFFHNAKSETFSIEKSDTQEKHLTR
jgi:vacuolar-type H+-ATPase subunit I/STV1